MSAISAFPMTVQPVSESIVPREGEHLRHRWGSDVKDEMPDAIEATSFERTRARTDARRRAAPNSSSAPQNSSVEIRSRQLAVEASQLGEVHRAIEVERRALAATVLVG